MFYFRYFLQPRSSRNRPSYACSTPPGTRLSVDNSLGSLRIQVQYTADHVFPARVYEPLRSLLLQSVHTTVSYFSMCIKVLCQYLFSVAAHYI